LNILINVVIVTYNNKELLKRCIDSVLISLKKIKDRVKITVVDNASNDGTNLLIQNNYPNVRYIENNKNEGLAKALNIGIRDEEESYYTLLLNDDVELFPETIKLMINMINNYPEAQGVPARLIYPDGSPQSMKVKIIGTQREFKNNIQSTYFAGTTACLYQTKLFKKIGYFDNFYFFYNEDLDFSLRAKRHGYKFIFNPNIKVIHHRNQGRNKAEKYIKPYFYSTDYYFYRKNFGLIFSSVYFIMAFCHIKYWKWKFSKEGRVEKLNLLEEGWQKLKYTMSRYKIIIKQSNVL